MQHKALKEELAIDMEGKGDVQTTDGSRRCLKSLNVLPLVESPLLKWRLKKASYGKLERSVTDISVTK